MFNISILDNISCALVSSWSHVKVYLSPASTGLLVTVSTEGNSTWLRVGWRSRCLSGPRWKPRRARPLSPGRAAWPWWGSPTPSQQTRRSVAHWSVFLKTFCWVSRTRTNFVASGERRSPLQTEKWPGGWQKWSSSTVETCLSGLTRSWVSSRETDFCCCLHWLLQS